ncbi:transglycosylase SLT domain-containing protein, partial [Candidatus Woesearchaeota archaeon]|nr:transglycosylase SLT domain-containing protein [Candidatus Woesearchaeota archaeon]
MRDKLKYHSKRAWNFFWNDDSIGSWIANIIVAFVLIRFLLYPLLGVILGTGFPIVAVVSESMEHGLHEGVLCGQEFIEFPESFENYWKVCGQWYTEQGITPEEFQNFKFKNGFNKGDVIILWRANRDNIQLGDILVFQGSKPQPIIHRVVKVFEENHLPTDLAYLALIESGYNPHAYSRAKAVGIWQFMQATGRRYGLKSNWWIDERRDPVKSTKAAANYLKDLYQIFGSWYLAVAAYNAGEGKILRSVKKHKTDNFWEMAKYRHLKRETKDYIPKFIAAMLIAKDPEKYGFTNLKYQEPISYEEVALTKPVDLHEVAKSIEISYEELKKLNPELKGFSTPLDLDHYTLKVPENKKEIFLVELESIPALKKTDLHQHQVSYGDTLWALSRTYGTSIPQIKKMNNLTSNVLRI